MSDLDESWEEYERKRRAAAVRALSGATIYMLAEGIAIALFIAALVVGIALWSTRNDDAAVADRGVYMGRQF